MLPKHFTDDLVHLADIGKNQLGPILRNASGPIEFLDRHAIRVDGKIHEKGF